MMKRYLGVSLCLMGSEKTGFTDDGRDGRTTDARVTSSSAVQ